MKDILPQLLKGFFLQWMAAGRQLSPETVASYRDAFSLMLRWFRDERGTDASEVGMDDLTAENVEEFLLYLAERRGNSAQTVNCRLAAIKAFCSYAAYRAPERLAEMKRISDIPRRTEKRREVGYLTQEEVGWLLDACDAASRRGQEDHLLLSLLFSTGARISEAVALRMRSFERRGGRLSVHLAGKGRKERTLPLWPEVAGEVTAFAEERQLGADDFVFPGRNVEHLSRSGARSRIDAAVRRASELHPALAGKRITPHVFRHSCAMAMLESGVDLSTIAIWLGHESVQTTHRYMVASMSRKEDALARVHPDSRQESGCRRYRAQGTSSASSNPCSAMHYVLGAGWPGPSACRPAPTRHIIASSALEQVFGHIKDEFFRGRDWSDFESFKRDLEAYIHHWNHARRQARPKGLTPVEYRDQALRETA